MSFIWFCAAGYSLFVGIALLTISMAFFLFVKQPWKKLIIYPFALIAIFLIFLSATPLHPLLYTLWTASVLGWLIFCAIEKLSKKPFTKFLTAIAFALSITVLLTQIPFYLKPSMPKQKFDKLYIIGDSVSAGIGGQNEMTWPKLLHDKHAINVTNLSQAGDTVTSAISQADKIDDHQAIILLEIGGNDLLASTAYSQFEKDLTQVLKTVTSDSSMVVMLELPIFAWKIEYGRIQRKLAKKFNVILIPKRFFVSVLSAKDATQDLAHLSPKGHQIMMEKIWSILEANLISIKSE